MVKVVTASNRPARLYKDDVRKRLKTIDALLSRVVRGDFTTLKKIPLDEFSGIYEGINFLLQGAQQKIGELHAIRAIEEALIESIGDGLIAVDDKLLVTLINGRALKLLGFRNAGQVLGKHLEDIMPLQDEQGNPIVGAARPTKSAIATGRKKRTTLARPYYYACKKKGDRFPVNITTAPILLNKRVIGAVSVFRDITEERRIDNAKSEFISLASHQLRTPLSIISLNLEIILKHFGTSFKNPEVRGHLETIQGASNRMINLVTELLNVSKIELGSFELVHAPLDLVSIVKESAASAEMLARKKNISISCSFRPASLRLNTDERALKEVLDNLLSNAVKYSEHGSVVGVKVFTVKNTVALSITDRGCGIPESEQDQIFSKMFRAHNVKQREEGGTGLGLYIARSLTEALGGNISFVSREGKGTTFTVTFPLSDAKTTAEKTRN